MVKRKENNREVSDLRKGDGVFIFILLILTAIHPVLAVVFFIILKILGI